MLSVAIDGVRQKRAADHQAAVADQQSTKQAAIADQQATKQTLLAASTGGGKALTGKPKTSAKAKAKPSAAAKVPQSTISPYLTSTDLLDVGTATANAENADSTAKFGLANAAANALRTSGDIGRATTKNVTAANDDAASRGLYDSGIRAGNVGMAQAEGARGQQGVRDSLAMAAAQSIAQRNAAKQQLGQQLQIYTQRAAENGAALPVDPYNSSPLPGANVKGAATARKVKVKR